MYRKILVALDTSASDQELLPHIARLATLMQSELLLVHVADGWAARNFEQLNLADSEEMRQDWSYLEAVAARLRADTRLTVTVRLVLGEPPAQLLKVAEEERVDLIALAFTAAPSTPSATRPPCLCSSRRQGLDGRMEEKTADLKKVSNAGGANR